MTGSGDRRRDRDEHRSYEEETRHRHRARSSYERRDRDDYRSSEAENGRDRRRHGARSDYEEDKRRDRDEDRRRDRDEVRQGRNNEEDKDRGPEEGREPELYATCRGRVHSIKPFGIFVRLDEYRCQGLVHISQVSSYEVSKRDDPDEAKVQAMSAIYGVGEAVWVKIISVKRDGGTVKIGCSLKHVAQSDGRDLDPSNLQLQLQESRPERQERQKTNLGAVYDVVCPRCGGHGHLKNECYSTGDKVYELVPEEDEEPERLVPQPQAVAAAASSEPQVHGRRERLPDNVSTVEEAKELIARLKAEKKEKKRLRKEEKSRKKTKKSKS